MKKVKVIFADGSTGEVDEKDLQAALSSGAKLASEAAVKKTTVKFADGSETEIEDSKVNDAIKAGATVLKKKRQSGYFCKRIRGSRFATWYRKYFPIHISIKIYIRRGNK